MAARLFESIKIGSLNLSNRIIVAPMCQYSADNGTMGDWHLAHLGQFSMGGSGLILIEATAVEPAGRISHGCCGLYSDENENGMGRIIKFCKAVGDSKIGIQLAHSGRKGSTERPWEGGRSLKVNEWQTFAPSKIPYADDWHIPEALDATGLERIKRSFVCAAERAVRLGIDVIELHAAHGYLLHQFLSPVSNLRSDEYGGKLENRMRYPLEIFKLLRSSVPSDIPIFVRVSASDWVKGGWDLNQTVAFAKSLENAGCSAIHVSSGGNTPAQKIKTGYGYQTAFARRVRDEVAIPVIAVGMITDPLQAETILQSEQADLIAIAREFLRDPHWTWRAAKTLGCSPSVPVQYKWALDNA